MAPRSDFGEPIPAAPFSRWLNERLARYETEHEQIANSVEDAADGGVLPLGPSARLSGELGWGIEDAGFRRLHRYRRQLKAGSRNKRKGDYPTDTFPRNIVEDALDNAGVPFAEVYPELAAAEDRPLEPDAFCGSCHEVVKPIDGRCPWCDREASDRLPIRMYCKHENAMRFPDDDGVCWRCHGPLSRHVPMDPCGCGRCEQRVRRFDAQGRRIKYAKGHNPPLNPGQRLPATPFVELLARRLAEVDRLQAMSFLAGMSRERLCALLRGDVAEVTQGEVAITLKSLAYDGRPSHHKVRRRADVPSLSDLYPRVPEGVMREALAMVHAGMPANRVAGRLLSKTLYTDPRPFGKRIREALKGEREEAAA